MSGSGQDAIEIGSKHIGEKYVFGAHVPLGNPGWRGPWDCAEFVSWCVYQAYGVLFGAGHARDLAKADPYSGAWYDEARSAGAAIPWRDALAIPGAVLIRRPTSRAHGHVAFAMGDGARTLEARGAAFGVGVFPKAADRLWSIGCLVPGVDYDGDAPPPAAAAALDPDPPADFLMLRSPIAKGPAVVALQRALLNAQIDPGPLDGEFGAMTSAALVCFQIQAGIEVDGVFGPATAAKLGLAFPIAPSDADVDLFRQIHGAPKLPKVALPAAPAAFDAVVDFTASGKVFSAKTASGATFILGTQTRYADDMTRVGLYQNAAATQDSRQFGAYQAADYPQLGQWAFFIEPTLKAEGGRFATLNTYDRAAFTFGAPQLAAHTPERNFIRYFRKLLQLPDADKHFPDLKLMPNEAGKTTVHRKKDGGYEDLEKVFAVTRPNGRTENQLSRLMTYLNASPTEVDAAELTAAARLMNWLRLDPRAKELQIEVFVEQMKENLQTAKRKAPAFSGNDWPIALWIMDILHQGRGSYREIAAALASGSPEQALAGIGARPYPQRIKTVAQAIEDLKKRGVLNGFTV